MHCYAVEGMDSFSLALWSGLNLEKGSQVVSQTWRQLRASTEKGSVGAICEGTWALVFGEQPCPQCGQCPEVWIVSPVSQASFSSGYAMGSNLRPLNRTIFFFQHSHQSQCLLEYVADVIHSTWERYPDNIYYEIGWGTSQIMPSCLEDILPINSVNEGLDINFIRFTNTWQPTLEQLEIFLHKNCEDWLFQFFGPPTWKKRSRRTGGNWHCFSKKQGEYTDNS